jgi:hypothetical protein
MKSNRLFFRTLMVSVLALPLLILLQQQANAAQTAPRAEWSAPKSKKAVPKSTGSSKATKSPKATATAGPPVTPNAETAETAVGATPTPPALPLPIVDQSQEVLDIDFAMAASIATIGPKLGYSGALSEEGILYDANGASPVGAEAASSRFATFPADVTLVRTPEKALAAGGSGSSWGSYAIKRGETILSAGRYVSVWRRETSGWKMVSELAAGKAPAAAAGSTGNGVLPKRPTSLSRPAASPPGLPSTAPTTPPAASPNPTPVPTPAPSP